MIFITGDVHDMGMGGLDQVWLKKRHNGISEMECAEKYAKLADSYGIPVTLFVTGKSVIEEPFTIKRINSIPKLYR